MATFGVILTKVEYIYIMQKRAIRICGNSDFRAHTRPIFYQFNTLCLPDLVNFNSMVFMYKVFNNSLPNNLLVISKRCTIVMSITLGIIMSTLK